MNSIKIILLIITIFAFTTIFFAEAGEFNNTVNNYEDESKKSFKSGWKQYLKEIKKEDNWNLKINKPTEQWVDKAVKFAFYKMTDNKEVSVEKLVKDLNKTLDAIYITHDKNTNKNHVHIKDIQYINTTVNYFRTQLCKKIECKEEKKKEKLEKKEKEYLLQQCLFNQLLQNIETSYWRAIPSENWQNNIIKQSEKFIEQESTLNTSGIHDNNCVETIIKKINEALNLHIDKCWFPDRNAISIIKKNIEINIRQQQEEKILQENVILTVAEKQEQPKEETKKEDQRTKNELNICTIESFNELQEYIVEQPLKKSIFDQEEKEAREKKLKDLLIELYEKGLEIDNLRQKREQTEKENKKNQQRYIELENERKKTEKEQNLKREERQQKEADARALAKIERRKIMGSFALIETEIIESVKFIKKVEERRKELRNIIHYKKDPNGFMKKYNQSKTDKLCK